MKNWKTSAEQILTAGPVVPVIVINKLEQAVPLAKALVAGGVRVLEVTLRTACGLEAIRAIANEVPEAIIGAGTVINPQQLREVTEAGRSSPSAGADRSLAAGGDGGAYPADPGHQHRFRADARYGSRPARIQILPGGSQRRREGAAGDRRPVPAGAFCPTGGITPSNYRDYLALKSVLCIGGSWLVPADALESGDYARITELARSAVSGLRCNPHRAWGWRLFAHPRMSQGSTLR